MSAVKETDIGIQLGGKVFIISCRNRRLIRALQDRYSNFIVSKKPGAFTVRVTVQGERMLQSAPARVGPATSIPPAEILPLGDRGVFAVRHIFFHGIIDIKRGEGTVSQVIPDVSVLDTFLRSICSAVFTPERGFMLHACGIARRGRAYLFCGRSSSGKTTLARLNAMHHTLLTDEACIVSGRNGRYSAFGTPFWGGLQHAGSNISVPVEAAYILEKSKSVSARRIGRAEAMFALLANIISFTNDPEFARRLFYICDDFTSRVPVYRLRFRPDNSFWRHIDVH